jgi:hypothetical protein
MDIDAMVAAVPDVFRRFGMLVRLGWAGFVNTSPFRIIITGNFLDLHPDSVPLNRNQLVAKACGPNGIFGYFVAVSDISKDIKRSLAALNISKCLRVYWWAGYQGRLLWANYCCRVSGLGNNAVESWSRWGGCYCWITDFSYNLNGRRLAEVSNLGANTPVTTAGAFSKKVHVSTLPHDVRPICKKQSPLRNIICSMRFLYLLPCEVSVNAYGYEGSKSDPEHGWVFWGPVAICISIMILGHGWYRLCSVNGKLAGDITKILLGFMSIAVGLPLLWWGISQMETVSRMW